MWKDTVSAYRPKLCGNCAFPQNFRAMKLDEITVFFAVDVPVSYPLKTTKNRRFSGVFRKWKWDDWMEIGSYRSSRPEVFYKRDALEKFRKIHRKASVPESLFLKSPVNFVKFLRTPFLTERLRLMPLFI